MPIDDIKENFTPYIVDSIKWNASFDDVFLSQHKKEFLKVWLEIFLNNPKEYVKEYLLNTLGYWDANKITKYSYIQYKNWDDEQPYAGVYQTDYFKEITGKSISDDLENVTLISAAAFGWMMLLSILITIKNKRYKNLLIYLPSLFTWGTIMIATPIAFTLRYVYILVLMLPLDFIIPFLKCGDENEKKDIKQR